MHLTDSVPSVPHSLSFCPPTQQLGSVRSFTSHPFTWSVTSVTGWSGRRFLQSQNVSSHALAVGCQPLHNPCWPPRCPHHTNIISINPCQPADWQPKQIHPAAQRPAQCPLNLPQQSACEFTMKLRERRTEKTVAMKSATHEIYHPDSLSQCLFQSWPRWSSRLIRCESEWEEDASETNGVCRTTSSSVILLVVSCLLQIFVRLASGDGWMRQRQRPDTPMMSHSSLPKPSPSPHTATQQRVMDYLSDMQHKLPPWFSIKGDSYKTEHILWLKYIYCSNPFLVYFQTAVSHFPCFFSSIIIISSLSFCGLVFAWSLLDDAFCICANNTSSWQKNKRQARKGETGGVSGIFFQAQPAYKSNPITPPLALQHWGTEWSTEEASLQQSAHCRLIRTFWVRRPPPPSPREAPHTTASQGQWVPQLSAEVNVLNGLGGSFLRGRLLAKGIISFQHGGRGRKWQPLTRLLTQSKDKAPNCCERCSKERKVVLKATVSQVTKSLWAGAQSYETHSVFPHLFMHSFILPQTMEGFSSWITEEITPFISLPVPLQICATYHKEMFSSKTAPLMCNSNNKAWIYHRVLWQ